MGLRSNALRLTGPSATSSMCPPANATLLCLGASLYDLAARTPTRSGRSATLRERKKGIRPKKLFRSRQRGRRGLAREPVHGSRPCIKGSIGYLGAASRCCQKLSCHRHHGGSIIRGGAVLSRIASLYAKRV